MFELLFQILSKVHFKGKIERFDSAQSQRHNSSLMCQRSHATKTFRLRHRDDSALQFDRHIIAMGFPPRPLRYLFTELETLPSPAQVCIESHYPYILAIFREELQRRDMPARAH